MMIITDTASDIYQDEAEELGVKLVPVDILLAGERFPINNPLEFNRFYELLKSSKDFPTTSQPAPELYRRLYREAQMQQEDVLVITLSGGLSGTKDAAQLAADASECSEDVYIFDSRHAIASQRILVEEAVRLREKHYKIKDIISHLEDLKERIKISGVLDSLEYLRRGGRIPQALAILGSILSIKPVITVNDGKLEELGKARGIKAAEKMLCREFDPDLWDSNYPISFLYSQEDKLARDFGSKFCEKYSIPADKTRFIQIGPVIGAHLGPDCVGLAFVSQTKFNAK